MLEKIVNFYHRNGIFDLQIQTRNPTIDTRTEPNLKQKSNTRPEPNPKKIPKPEPEPKPTLADPTHH